MRLHRLHRQSTDQRETGAMPCGPHCRLRRAAHSRMQGRSFHSLSLCTSRLVERARCLRSSARACRGICGRGCCKSKTCWCAASCAPTRRQSALPGVRKPILSHRHVTRHKRLPPQQQRLNLHLTAERQKSPRFSRARSLHNRGVEGPMQLAPPGIWGQRRPGSPQPMRAGNWWN